MSLNTKEIVGIVFSSILTVAIPTVCYVAYKYVNTPIASKPANNPQQHVNSKNGKNRNKSKTDPATVNGEKPSTITPINATAGNINEKKEVTKNDLPTKSAANEIQFPQPELESKEKTPEIKNPNNSNKNTPSDEVMQKEQEIYQQLADIYMFINSNKNFQYKQSGFRDYKNLKKCADKVSDCVAKIVVNRPSVELEDFAQIKCALKKIKDKRAEIEKDNWFIKDLDCETLFD